MKRNKNIGKVLSLLKSGKYVTSKDLEIHIPTYFSKELVSIEETINIVGSFAYVIGNEYAVSSSLSILRIKPSGYKIDGEYHIFSFKAGEVVFETNDVLINGGVIHPIIDTYLFKAKIPWYLDYEDINDLLLYASEDTGLDIDISPQVIAMMVASIATMKETGNKVRHEVKDKAKLFREMINYNQMDSVHNVDNSLNKIMGNHQSEGMLSALTVEDNEEPTLTENALLS